MPRQTNNSPSKANYGPAWLEKGTIYNVDSKNWTVDVVSEYSSKLIEQVQLQYPYFHTARGEGICFMPEVGAVVMVCFPSDNDPPFVAGFLSSFESEFAESADLDAFVGDADEEDLPQTPTAGRTSANPEPAYGSASARAGRPFLNPGDIMLSTRDNNRLIMRRGGAIQLICTPICQTAYLPITNMLRHFAENTETVTPGGVWSWTVKRQDIDPAGEAPSVLRLALRDKAQNDKADIQVRWGHIDETVRYEVVVAPQGVDVDAGSYSSEVYHLTVDISGNRQLTLSGDVRYRIGGQRDVTVGGDDTLAVTGGRSEQYGSLSRRVDGSVEQTVAGSRTVTIEGVNRIDAQKHQYGPGPTAAAVLGDELVQWLATHTHSGPNTPPKEAALLSKILSGRMQVPK